MLICFYKQHTRGVMINEENLKKGVLTELQKIADEGRRKYSLQIESEFIHAIPAISKELLQKIMAINYQYRDLQKQGQVGELMWIYISFLRTAFIDQSPCYRIDFYDIQGCISNVECTDTWGFDFIFDNYYEIKTKVMNQVLKQTRFRTYESDSIMNGLAEYFRQLADARIPLLIKNIEEDLANLLNYRNVKILLGEFLDHAEVIAEIGAVGVEIVCNTYM